MGSTGIKTKLHPKWKWLFLAISIFFLLCWSQFFFRKTLFFQIPIHFSKSGLPCINAEIEGAKYLVELDSGADFYFSLNKELINKIKNKKIVGTIQSSDIKGNLYVSPLFCVDSILVERFQFANVTIKEENPDFHLEGSILNPPISNKLREDFLEIPGRVGSTFFQSTNYWLLDLPHSRLVAIRDFDKCKKLPVFSFENFSEVSLEQSDSYIVISIATDIGIKKFVLDTGSRISLVKPPPELGEIPHQTLITNQFIIGGKDFGRTKLHLFNLAPSFKCDGLLGRDFLMKHQIYLDFKNCKAFIGPTEERP